MCVGLEIGVSFNDRLDSESRALRATDGLARDTIAHEGGDGG